MLVGLFLSVYEASAQRTVGLTNYTSEASDGYVLFAPLTFEKTYLIDACGDLVHDWDHAEPIGTATELLPNGNLLRTERMLSSVNGAGVGGRFVELDWDGNVVRSLEIASDSLHAHHDVAVLPNGNLLAILWEVHDRADALSQGADGDLLDGTIWSERIVELAPTTNSWVEVWRWRVWDHLIQDFNPSADNFGVISENPRRIDINLRGSYVDANLDWLHFNSITASADGKQIVLSARSMNEIYIVDHTTTTAEAASSTGGEFGMGGELLYRYGNDANYAEGIMIPRPFYGQHDTRFTEVGPNRGSLTVFNNGVNRVGGEFSSVYRWVPRFDFAGNYLLENNVFPAPLEVQELALDFSLYSSILSSAQPMSTGGYLVNVGRLGAFLELDQAGNELWRYVSPVGVQGPVRQGLRPAGANVFQINHYPVTDSRFDGRTLSSGDPIELDPAISLCLVVSTSDLDMQDMLVYPNPTQALLTIVDAPLGVASVRVFDAQGRVVLHEPFVDGRVDLSGLATGLYLVGLADESGRLLSQFRVGKT